MRDVMDESTTPSNFIRNIIEEERQEGQLKEPVHTRFPPEPNGYLHIGHAKSICLNFGLAQDYQGQCNLRFDDTNPTKEDDAYVDAIKQDVQWLGFDWEDRLFFASDYFERLYAFAQELIRKGKAYVCQLDADEIRAYRGTLTEPGRESPYRNRDVDENLELFHKMRQGEFEDGACVLRAKIDMASPVIQLRDPTLYRIRRAHHHRTQDAWCIYPMYDFTHCLSDALEGITHSLCTLEFENHRPLYNWILDQLDVPCHPRQIEFARLNLSHTLMSKRRLLQLVEDGHVDGWDDPRMPTIAGMRRRGVSAASIRAFCDRIGVARADSMVDIGLLEFCVREDLNKTSPRVMAVLNPLKLTITNYPDDKVEEIDAPYMQGDESYGSRIIPFCRELLVEREDFREQRHKKWYRLAPGQEVRLKFAYYVTCDEVVRDQNGDVVELRCSYDPATRGGWSEDGRKVRGTLHWVSARHALPAEVRQYEHLFDEENPAGRKDVEIKDLINPNSVVVNREAVVEQSLRDAEPAQRVQFERQGYFCLDSKLSAPSRPVFNRTVSLRDTWAKIAKKLDR